MFGKRTNIAQECLQHAAEVLCLLVFLAGGPCRLGTGGTLPSSLTDAWNALHWNLPHAIPEACEPRMHLPDLTLLPLNELLDDLWEGGLGNGMTLGYDSRKLHDNNLKYSHSQAITYATWITNVRQEMCLVTHLLLPPYDSCEFCVDDVGVEFTPHKCGTLIVFDVALVY